MLVVSMGVLDVIVDMIVFLLTLLDVNLSAHSLLDKLQERLCVDVIHIADLICGDPKSAIF